MSERTEYAPGTPSWVDHASPDPAGAAQFYSAVFGWETENRMPPDQDGEYHMASLRGKDVAALGSQPMEGAPAVWNTYITVASADDGADQVKAAGGTVVMDPFDVFDAGRMAVCSDPAGAFFSVWEPKESIGAELVNETGTLSWNELVTNDVDGSKRFYGDALGWQTSAFEAGGDAEYTIWHPPGAEPKQGPDEGGNGMGGMIGSRAWPEGTPNFWLAYFAVDDTDATVARAEELGGAVAAPAFDVPGVGRMAVLADPQGAVFAVIQPSMD
jgi:predicted enzyme related to lactoylglutathione lyase